MNGLEVLNKHVNKLAERIVINSNLEMNASNISEMINLIYNTEDVAYIRKCLKILDIISKKPQFEFHLIQLGKIKTYDEYLICARDWELEYWDLQYEKEEFYVLKEAFCNE